MNWKANYPALISEAAHFVDLISALENTNDNKSEKFSSLDNVVNIPEEFDIDMDQFQRLFNRAWEAKKLMAHALGLGADYRRFMTVEDPDMIKSEMLFQNVRAAYCRALNWDADLTPVDVVTGTIKDKHGRDVRLSRVLSRTLPDGIPCGWHSPTYADGCNDCLKKDKAISDLFDLAKNAKRTIMISCNPFDIWTQSFNAGFRSCHAPNGIHAAGSLAYSIDGVSFVCAVVDTDRQFGHIPYKHGRRMGFLSECRMHLVIGRKYGNFHDTLCKPITGALTSSITVTMGFGAKEWIGTSKNFPNLNVRGEGPVYFDYGIGRYSRISTRKKGDFTIKLAAEVPCLSCGKDHSTEDAWVCEDCHDDSDSWHCADCGERRTDDPDNYSNDSGDPVCYHCARNYHNCEECNERMHENNSFYVTNMGNLCRSCYDDLPTCDRCGDHRMEGDLRDMPDDQSWCNSCERRYWVDCHDCGEDGAGDSQHMNRVRVPVIGRYGSVTVYVCDCCNNKRIEAERERQERIEADRISQEIAEIHASIMPTELAVYR